MSSYIPIASQTLGSSASSVTFSSIPTTLNGKTLRDLVLVMSVKATAGTPATYIRTNSSLGDYYGVWMFGDGSSASSSTQPNSSRLYASTSTDYANFTVITAQFFDFAQTNKHKSVLSRWGSATNINVGAYAGRWDKTTAISSLLIYPDSFAFEAGSTFSLYGIEG